MRVWINPLLWVGFSHEPVDHEDLWRFVSARPDGPPPDLDEIAERWRQVAPDGSTLAFGPAEEGIISRIVWPLRSAVVAFGLGDKTAAVAMCGMAAEMITMLWWSVESPGKDGKDAPWFSDRIKEMESAGVDQSLISDLRQLKGLAKEGPPRLVTERYRGRGCGLLPYRHSRSAQGGWA